MRIDSHRIWVCLVLFVAGSPLWAVDKPNVIFILADDLGFGDVGFNGQKKIKTPQLDKLADEGMVLNSFYAGAPVCGPSRASLLSGMHTGHCKIRGNPRWTVGGKPIDFDDSDMTLGKVMKAAGYACGYFGKWGLNENTHEGTGHPNQHGFDEFWGFIRSAIRFATGETTERPAK